MHPRVCVHKHFDLITNPFKYECETFQILIHPCQKKLVSAKCNSWIVDLTTFKVNDSTHLQMLMVQEIMWRNSLTHSNINLWGIKLLFVFQYKLVNAKCNVWIMISINSKNVKKFIKSFKYNCQLLSCMYFDIS
jgi:hypothetical protein